MSFYPGGGSGQGPYYNSNNGAYNYGNQGMQEYSQPQRRVSPPPQRREREAPHQYKSRQGVITKLQPDFGLIDEEVFFSLDSVVGFRPRIGARVHAEAIFNPNSQPRWKAVKVTALTQPSRPTEHAGPQEDRERERRDRERERDIRAREARERDKAVRDRELADRDSKRREEKRPERDTRDVSVSSSRKRSRSPRARASGSPPRRRPRMPKYVVNIPKFNTDLSVATVNDLRRRFSSLYVPSDFFLTKPRWQESFPLKSPFSLDHFSSFHIFHKDVESINGPRTEVHPPDADYKYSAKVMLMSLPGLEEMYRKSLVLAESGSDREGVHPSCYLKFLVGAKGKQEYIPIGGPWSPSLDGADAENDPQVLIKTAIRTCKMLTGVDLSNCTQWCRFMEIYYRRSETSTKPATVETVVFYLPDVWNCMPTRIEWKDIKDKYKKSLETQLLGEPHDGEGESKDTVVEETPAAEDKKVMEPKPEPPTVKAEPDANQIKVEEPDSEGTPVKLPPQKPKIDIQSMKVVEIKAELDARGLNTKGIKSELCSRLADALETEEAEALAASATVKQEDVVAPAAAVQEENAVPNPLNESTKVEDVKMEELEVTKEEPKETPVEQNAAAPLDEAQKKHLEKIYGSTGSTPAIVVHPSKVAKKGEFDCTVVSLKNLIDHRPGELKEHTFEVHLFAELFQDLMFRDNGYEIYKALVNAPNIVEEEKKARLKAEQAESKKEGQEKGTENVDMEDLLAASSDAKILGEIPLEEGIDEDMLSKFVVVDQLDDAEDMKVKKEPSHDSKKSEPSKTGENGRDSQQKSRTEERKKIKEFTADKKLLLSCIYFDINQCGYILDKDLEEMLLNIGLLLSRSQAKRLIAKVVGKNSFYYRKLTDKPVPGDDKDVPEQEAMATEETSDLYGNLNLLSIADRDNKSQAGSGSRDQNSGIVTYSGRVYNLDQLLLQAEKAEKDRTLADNQLKRIQDELSSFKSKYDSTSSKLRKSEDDVKSYKQKLTTTEMKLKEAKVSNDKYESALRLVYHHVAPFVEEKRPASSAAASETDK